MSLQRHQILGGLGILGSLFWLSLNTLLSPDWGPPGSARYVSYETTNRLWALAFAGMLCGCLGLAARYRLAQSRLGRVAQRLAAGGLLVMIAGNMAEFWLFSQQAYGELNGRNLAWIGVLLGWLTTLTGLGLLGLAIWRGRFLPVWSGVLLALALPATIALIISSAINWMGWPLIIATALVGGLAAWPEAAPLAAKGTAKGTA
jgi:hypothetical protein